MSDVQAPYNLCNDNCLSMNTTCITMVRFDHRNLCNDDGLNIKTRVTCWFDHPNLWLLVHKEHCTMVPSKPLGVFQCLARAKSVGQVYARQVTKRDN